MTNEICLYTPKYISTATTTSVQPAGNCYLHIVNVPIALTGTATFRDLASSPNTYFVLPIGTVGSFTFDDVLSNGLEVVTSAADKLIISSKQG